MILKCTLLHLFDTVKEVCHTVFISDLTHTYGHGMGQLSKVPNLNTWFSSISIGLILFLTEMWMKSGEYSLFGDYALPLMIV